MVGFSRCFHLSILIPVCSCMSEVMYSSSISHLSHFLSPLSVLYLSLSPSFPDPHIVLVARITLDSGPRLALLIQTANLSRPLLTPSTSPKGGLKPYQPSSFSFLPSVLLYLSQRSLDPWVEWLGHDSGQLSAKPPALWCSVCLCICLCTGLQFIRPLIHPSVAGVLCLRSPWLLRGVGHGYMMGGCQSGQGGGVAVAVTGFQDHMLGVTFSLPLSNAKPSVTCSQTYKYSLKSIFSSVREVERAYSHYTRRYMHMLQGFSWNQKGFTDWCHMKELFISSSLENHVLVSFGDPYYFMFFHGAKNTDYFLRMDSVLQSYSYYVTSRTGKMTSVNEVVTNLFLRIVTYIWV